MSYRVAVIENDDVLAANICSYLSSNGYDTLQADSIRGAIQMLASRAPDFAIVDLQLPDGDGREVLSYIDAASLDTVPVMMSGNSDVGIVVESMRSGAVDYLVKPFELRVLKRVLERNEKQHTLSRGNGARLEQIDYLNQLHGRSQAMVDLRAQIEVLGDESRAHGASTPVLIVGEVGTEKELVARAIHSSGSRRGAMFTRVDCASVPADMLEVELFGFESGAYRSDRERKIGQVSIAESGTLLIDAIDNMPVTLQRKVTGLIKDGVYRRIGRVDPIVCNVRVIASTTADPQSLMARELMLQELGVRLDPYTVRVPPLRERGEDTIAMAEEWLSEQSVRSARRYTLSTEACDAIRSYHWPGNALELQGVLDRATRLALDGVIRVDALGRLAGASPESVGVGHGFPEAGLHLKSVESDMIVQALYETGGNVSKAATLLGISRDQLRYRMAKRDMTRKDFT